MLLACNRTNLKKHAQALLGNEYSPEKEKALLKECLTGFERDPYFRHISHDQARHLERIDAILGTYGVEGIFEWKTGGSVDCTNYDPDDVIDVQYCNAGDTYALTILYVNGKLKLGDWGSLFE